MAEFLKKLNKTQTERVLTILEERFTKYMNRHKGIQWDIVKSRLLVSPVNLCTIYNMELSGGEPDVVKHDEKNGEIWIMDCSPETPLGRRSLCYDEEALIARKENRPAGSAMGMAETIGIELLDQAQYTFLQSLGNFDLKTSSWLKTPEDIRKKGGAIFGDNRYGRTFIYHNGVQSYYAVRGFRGLHRV